MAETTNGNTTTFTEDGTIDTWTVPATGLYEITAIGATGGAADGTAGGAGAEVTGEFELTANQVLDILVGQEGAAYIGGGGGGGGSFVALEQVPGLQDIPLAIAGGGGGAGFARSGNGGPGESGIDGGTGTDGGSGGVSFGGGASTAAPGGGGGFVGNGTGTEGGQSFENGGGGGVGMTAGGFGGGGAGGIDAAAQAGGGGGGGASGGGGGGIADSGGGGGSYLNGAAIDPVIMTGVETTGNGEVMITEEMPCFCRGTLILTPSGEVPVEELRAGDLVATLSGAAQPIVWIGSGRSLVTAANPQARPVIVRRGALDEGVPSRDLYLTAAHSLYLDGVLIPVEHLVNGRSILWDEAARAIEFYHVELARHDILLADGAPAESYRDDGNRAQFHNYPGDRPATPPTPSVAPVIADGPTVLEAWRRLLRRSGFTPPALTRDPDLHLLADGARLDPVAAEDGAYRFRLDRRPTALRLRSRSFVPHALGLNRDRRRLGVAVRRLALSGGGIDLVLSADAACLADGFHHPEPGFRWTSGDAAVPARVLRALAAPFDLIVTLADLAEYPLAETADPQMSIAA